jgi:tRNA threonylcarbamoyl adenosine modification protein (Sua5/YciO/YrdC/YwlC family)
MQLYTSLSDPNVSKLLLAGKVGIIPTDTTYGVVAAAADRSAASRLYALKSRISKPGTIIANNIEQLVSLGVTRRYLKAVENFWPNPISIEIPLDEHLDYLHQGTGRMAFRLPLPGDLTNLLSRCGPLLTTSANSPGKPVATTMAEAQNYFGSSVDFYVDGGDLAGRQPSTIIRIIDDAIDVIRPGAIKVDEHGNIG